MSAFIDERRARFGVEPICETLDVSASAYYQRATGERSARQVEDERLLAVIRETHERNYCAYGLGKTLVAIAAEQRGRGLGRCRMQVIDDAKAGTLREFLLDHVLPGEVVITDGWASYAPACEGQYEHRPEPVAPSELPAHALLPGVHRVASLAKRWLLGTHQGGVKPAHLQAYLDEFTFRFNRRRSGSRGMLFYRLLEQAVQSPPRTYRSLVADPAAGRRELAPPGPDKRVRPPSLAGEAQDRPWRKSRAATPLSAESLH